MYKPIIINILILKVWWQHHHTFKINIIIVVKFSIQNPSRSKIFNRKSWSSSSSTTRHRPPLIMGGLYGRCYGFSHILKFLCKWVYVYTPTPTTPFSSVVGAALFRNPISSAITGRDHNHCRDNVVKWAISTRLGTIAYSVSPRKVCLTYCCTLFILLSSTLLNQNTANHSTIFTFLFHGIFHWREI